MNVTRGTVLSAAFTLSVALVLAGCGSDAKDDATADGGTPTPAASWFQVRPVLTEAEASAADCAAKPTTPQNVASAAAICSVDKTTVYSLGPAVLDDGNADSVGSTDKTVQIGLTPSGKETFTTLTTELADEKAPRNQFAAVVDGQVLDAPTVEKAVTDGMLLLTLDDAAAVEPFMLRLSS